MSQAEKIITLKSFSFGYEGSERKALNNIDFQVKKGEFLGITGPTGAGKSTLVNCINGVIPHFINGSYEGEVFVAGRCVGDTTSQELSRVIGTVFQDPEAQIISANVEEELAFGPENLGLAPKEIMERIEFSLQAVGIRHLREATVSSLSGGQKQRVAIAAVLTMLPEIIILDEPTAELDPIGTDDVFRVLKELNEKHGITVIMIEHKLEHLAQSCSRLLVLKEGRIKIDGKPSAVFVEQEKIKDLGLRPPQVTELIGRLVAAGKGRGTTEIPVTLEEAKSYLDRVLARRESRGELLE